MISGGAFCKGPFSKWSAELLSERSIFASCGRRDKQGEDLCWQERKTPLQEYRMNSPGLNKT